MSLLGIRNPRRTVLICTAATIVAWAVVLWGVLEMHVAGDSLAAGLKIGLGLLPALIAPALVWNFWRGMAVFAAIRRGDNEIGRWTVTAADLAAFSAAEMARNARGKESPNVWRVPKDPPPGGIEVIVAADGVLVGDTYFALVTIGPFRIRGVRMRPGSPPAISFSTTTTLANQLTVHRTVDALDIPVSPAASDAAARVLRHYQGVLASEVVVDADFYGRRVRFGLTAAPICFAVAALGLLLDWTGAAAAFPLIPDILIIIGAIFGTTMLILAGAGIAIGRAKRRAR